jgi:hypothetical protein
MQVHLASLAQHINEVRSRNDSEETVLKILQAAGDKFWRVEANKAEDLRKSASRLFDTINPYTNMRSAGVAPDESKLVLLLGGYASDVMPKISSLDEVKAFLSQAASEFLQQHVLPADLRKQFRDTADQIRDEDAVPYRSSTSS